MRKEVVWALEDAISLTSYAAREGRPSSLGVGEAEKRRILDVLMAVAQSDPVPDLRSAAQSVLDREDARQHERAVGDEGGSVEPENR